MRFALEDKLICSNLGTQPLQKLLQGAGSSQLICPRPRRQLSPASPGSSPCPEHPMSPPTLPSPALPLQHLTPRWCLPQDAFTTPPCWAQAPETSRGQTSHPGPDRLPSQWLRTSDCGQVGNGRGPDTPFPRPASLPSWTQDGPLQMLSPWAFVLVCIAGVGERAGSAPSPVCLP